ncbi:MAG: DNA polymerase III subunit beta [Nitrospira sp. SB0672_bin_25]|nr:DNA polymerase III subunit beta [Nitrospira sp. SB0666_bin_27]MYF24159.1 DNA polymerase III subunit beta [Nitrospira sp. SB0678_bin_10]MYJ53812.1 DNA polymerase III subunit beta [Nitrospira sp. SB0672_bin_25]
MRVTVEREVLLTALHRVQGIVEKRNTMPSLANVLLEAKKEGLDISATDLELGMRGLYKATVEEPGSVTFSARKLYEILKEIKDQEIAMTVTSDCLVTITTGRGEFKVVGLPSKDFPPLPAIERDGLIPLPGTGLLQLIRKTLFAVGDNDTRYVLNGLLVVVTGAGGTPLIRLVGTDGHRLAMAEQKLATDKKSSPEQEEKVIVPKKAAAEIRRLLEEDEDEPMIGFTKNMLIFRKSGLVLTSRLMEGNYPNYQQVIPKAGNKQITVNRDDLEGALRRVSVLSQNKTYAVKLTFSKKAITLFSSHPDMGEANEEIPASFNGEEFSAGFNARYLLDVLSVLESETVVLNMEASLSPCLIREKDNALFQAVVMPVKV